MADALGETGMHLAMITPGAHSHFAYGGIASLDPQETRKAAEELGRRTVDLAYGPLRKAWHPDPALAPPSCSGTAPSATTWPPSACKPMYQNLKESVAGLCRYEANRAAELYVAIEPKPNEGHPAMLLPTVASAILFWRKLEEEFGDPAQRQGRQQGVRPLRDDRPGPVYDTVEELDNDAMVHMHLNSQGYNDGIVLGGPGKYDIDHGARVNGMNIAIAGLIAGGRLSRAGRATTCRPGPTTTRSRASTGWSGAS